MVIRTNSSQNEAEPPTPPGLSGFFRRLAQYYAEFLATDFKRQRLPKRRLETSDAKGRLVGIPLRKYPGFEQRVWEQLAKPIQKGLSLTVPRRTWLSSLPKTVTQALTTHIDHISDSALDAVVNRALTAAHRFTDQPVGDPEVAFEQFIEELRATLARRVLRPLLDDLQRYFDRTEHKPLESLGELEDQLSTRLVNGVQSASGPAFSVLLVETNMSPLEELLRDQLSPSIVRAQISEFFETFAAGDLYVDLTDLSRSSRLIENVDTYLHLGEVHHAGQIYPIFYIPFLTVRKDRSFSLDSEPRLYVNKRAMDYVAQDIAKAEGRTSIPSVIQDRILFLSPDDSVVQIAQTLLDDIAASLNIRAEVDLSESRPQKIASLFAVLTNRMSLSLFDRSDESMINDYEALLSGLETDADVVEFFAELIDDFLLKNPVSVRAEVDDAWDRTPMAQRLVFDSPLPLVEEQRKILSAIQNPNARFIAVEGPPGTGKSHTITAVAFNTILSAQSLLVLSDKKEALDVVESKLNQVLAKIRPTEKFLNPILRLGARASNYAQLMSHSSIDRLQIHHRVVRQRRNERNEALKKEREALLDGLEAAAQAYKNIDIAEIASLERELATLIDRSPESEQILEDPHLLQIIEDFGYVSDFVRGQPKLGRVLAQYGKRPRDLIELAQIAELLSDVPVNTALFAQLPSFTNERLDALAAAIDNTEDAALPIVGYLFAGRKLRAIARDLRDRTGIVTDQIHRDLPRLRLVLSCLHSIRERLLARNRESAFPIAVTLVAEGLAGKGCPPLLDSTLFEPTRRLEHALVTPLLVPAADCFFRAMLEATEGPLGQLHKLGELRLRELRICRNFDNVPEIDYLGAKSRIESLNTQALADAMDERIIDYYNRRKNDAATLRKIIRDKQRFPLDKFVDLQTAFPCIIAGLRDYAEFIPLKRNLFDLVIIDEASQVSIAQALPAIIRAKKVLVLGDRNQFGNVKTANASRQINTAYIRDLLATFAKEYPSAGPEVQTRVDLFDIRHSVLDFIEPISNFDIQLKKHFRSYPEMISFSSKYFYEDGLQVMKIRGKPIEKVIGFESVAHDGLIDQRNVNHPEATTIIDKLNKYLESGTANTVGVITPHTEQQAYIAKLVNEEVHADDIWEKLRLKVMTFDTCQGEEREIILYSLVATAEKDRLGYVFPRELNREGYEEIDHNLRLQRLNVGLSRGQEQIIFFHSKPLEEYSSALRVALQHYRRERERARSLPTPDELDNASPMELKLLHWLSQVPLIRDLGDRCEIVAQFELGKYLRQLDPSYRHPDYRVDFLMSVSTDDQLQQLVIEYDGFEFHFRKDIPASQITESTWSSYLTPADLEREKVLESFGVKMLRLNRFNIGKNPVITIDRLLRERLNSLPNSRRPHTIVTEVAAKTAKVEQGLGAGNLRHCKKCDRDLPLEMFSSTRAKSGYSRHCRDCRTTRPPSTGGFRYRRFRRRY